MRRYHRYWDRLVDCDLVKHLEGRKATTDLAAMYNQILVNARCLIPSHIRRIVACIPLDFAISDRIFQEDEFPEFT